MSFAILKSHLEKGKQDVVIAVLQTFRTYLQYHIKMAKSHFHSKMRKRVVELIKVCPSLSMLCGLKGVNRFASRVICL